MSLFQQFGLIAMGVFVGFFLGIAYQIGSKGREIDRKIKEAKLKNKI